MSFETRHRSTVRRALTLVGLILTLAGLFAMHGLAQHGTGAMVEAHGSAPTMTSGSSATQQMTHVASRTLQAVAATPAAATGAVAAMASDSPSSGLGMDMGAAGMCVAVLLLTALALTLRLQASRLRPVVSWTLGEARAPVFTSRRPDPPNLFVLSIQRC